MNNNRTEPSNTSLSPRYRGHFIVCGLRNLGFRVLQQLQEAGLTAVVIDDHPDPTFAELARHDCVKLMERDSTNKQTLLEAGVIEAAAVIAVTDDDLTNLKTVLAANELAPGIRTVASFYNLQIGQQLINNKATPNAVALNIAALTAPNLVIDALITSTPAGQVLHPFEIAGERMVVATDRAGEAGQIRQLYGPAVTPVLVETTGVNMMLCPPPSREIKKDDLVTLVGRVADLAGVSEVKLNEQQLAEAAGQLRRRPSKTAKNGKRRPSVFGLWRGLLRNILQPFRQTLIAVAVTLLVGTLFFYFYKGFNPVEALYFTFSEIASNGNLSTQDSTLAHLVSIGLILVGTAILTILYANITNFIVSARLGQVFGQQKVTQMEDHVILVGLEAIGYGVLRGLHEQGQSVAVIEQDDKNRYIPLARHLGVPVLSVDARLADSLTLANPAKARCICITTQGELGNLEMAVNARAANPKIRVVMRLFDDQLAEQIEQTFGIHRARSTSALAAPYFVGAALNFQVVTSFYVRHTPFFVAQLTVRQGSVLSQLSVRDVYTRTKLSVMAYIPAEKLVSTAAEPDGLHPNAFNLQVRQHTPVFNPPSDKKLEANEVIYFVGPCRYIAAIYQLNAQDSRLSAQPHPGGNGHRPPASAPTPAAEPDALG